MSAPEIFSIEKEIEGAPKEGTTSAEEEQEYAPEQPNTGSGDEGQRSGEAVGETSIDFTLIERRFKENKRNLKPRTQDQYLSRFRWFATKVNLGSYTRSQLRGKLGRELLLSYIHQINERSRRTVIAYLRPVWTLGLQLDWPIVVERDIGRTPPKRIIPSPPDSAVRDWKGALEKEEDIYIRVLITLGLQFGWRPSHITRLKWGHIQYDETLKLHYLLADGVACDFKTNAPIAAYIPEDVMALLNSWKKQHPAPHPASLIFPWRGKVLVEKHFQLIIRPHQALPEELVTGYWKKFRKKWNLEPLTPRDARHWVATTTRRAGLSPQAAALLMGHDLSNIGEGMRAAYDHPHIQEWLLEQKRVLPRGCLGRLEPQPQLTTLPPDVAHKIEAVIAEYLDMNITLRVATERLGDILEEHKNRTLKERLLTT